MQQIVFLFYAAFRSREAGMPDQFVIEHCAPTLAGLKTGSLFSIETDNARDACREIRDLNRTVRGKGLRAIPVRRRNRNTLIYLYRPDDLRRALAHPEAEEILTEKGYNTDDADLCIMQLIHFLAGDGAFPHEIGLFLGYPPRDVKGFMKSPHEGVQCSGCWKVYGDKEKAEKTFEKFRQCTACYKKEFQNGRTLEQLTVRTRARG